MFSALANLCQISPKSICLYECALGLARNRDRKHAHIFASHQLSRTWHFQKQWLTLWLKVRDFFYNPHKPKDVNRERVLMGEIQNTALSRGMQDGFVRVRRSLNSGAAWTAKDLQNPILAQAGLRDWFTVYSACGMNQAGETELRMYNRLPRR